MICISIYMNFNLVVSGCVNNYDCLVIDCICLMECYFISFIGCIVC